MFQKISRTHIDWFIFLPALFIAIAGMVTMNSFTDANSLFVRQGIFLIISIIAFFVFHHIDFRFLRRTNSVVLIYIFSLILLVLVLFIGNTSKGAQSWISFGPFSLQPSDPAKLALIILLAKYFSRRHVEIAHVRHILVSGAYAVMLALLVLLQPDFGSALVLFAIWLGLILVSGVSKKHLMTVFLIGTILFAGLWAFGFKDYQKKRILNFIHPLADIRGSGYNAYQAMVTVGSGQILGKGIGYGTQSRLEFLPEYETDFIFAAFAEEWGFVGVILLLLCYGIIIFRILSLGITGESNFEILYALGLAIYFGVHMLVNIGMNLGLMPVTGIPLPFMSYGGSHLLVEFAALGILMGMKQYRRATHREVVKNEFIVG
jgi:rod shape determining protein RodA